LIAEAPTMRAIIDSMGESSQTLLITPTRDPPDSRKKLDRDRSALRFVGEPKPGRGFLLPPAFIMAKAPGITGAEQVGEE
jgi:hypothetical protein